jgi:hypothetical protein
VTSPFLDMPHEFAQRLDDHGIGCLYDDLDLISYCVWDVELEDSSMDVLKRGPYRC